MQGAKAARPFVERANPTFTTAVDRSNELSHLFGYKAVPNGVMASAEGRILYARYGGFSISEEETVPMLESLLRGEPVSQETTGPLAGRISADAARRVKDLQREGAELYDGDTTGAMSLWREALLLDPNNYTIRKQIWAVEHPEKFYPEIDWDWQAEQLREERQAERAAR